MDAVYNIRRSFQEAMKAPVTAVVEQALGRKVVAYMSMIHHDPDLAVELLVLEPRPEIPIERLERDLENEEPVPEPFARRRSVSSARRPNFEATRATRPPRGRRTGPRDVRGTYAGRPVFGWSYSLRVESSGEPSGCR